MSRLNEDIKNVSEWLDVLNPNDRRRRHQRCLCASALENIEEVTGKRVADYFDLIAGTSTAIGVALGIATAEFCNFITKRPDLSNLSTTGIHYNGIDAIGFDKLNSKSHWSAECSCCNY